MYCEQRISVIMRLNGLDVGLYAIRRLCSAEYRGLHRRPTPVAV